MPPRSDSPPKKGKRAQVLRWLRAKPEKLRSLIHNPKPSKTIASLLIGAIMSGWLMALVRLYPSESWDYIVVYEVLETLFDLLVFIPGFFLIRQFFFQQYQRHEEAEKLRELEAAEQRKREDEILSGDDEDGEGADTVANVLPSLAATDQRQQIIMSYFIYSRHESNLAWFDIDLEREEQDYFSEQAFKNEMRYVKIVRLCFLLLGFIPFGIGYYLSEFQEINATQQLLDIIGVALSS